MDTSKSHRRNIRRFRNRPRRGGAKILLAALLLLLARTSAAPAQSVPYTIHPQDLLKITVWRHPDLETEAEVDAEGNVNLPLLGKVRAAGYTDGEMEAALAELWGKSYIKDPYIRVYIKNRKFFVLGEVKQPGDYDLEGRVTILMAVSMAGGFTDYGAEGNVYILRGRGENASKINVDINDIRKGKAPDIEIRPGDVITVPQSLF
jgi:polysaccharide export outer membrane protein